MHVTVLIIRIYKLEIPSISGGGGGLNPLTHPLKLNTALSPGVGSCLMSKLDLIVISIGEKIKLYPIL